MLCAPPGVGETGTYPRSPQSVALLLTATFNRTRASLFPFRFKEGSAIVSAMMRVLVNAPRWLLVVSLVFAPWAYGSTRFWAVHVLDVLLGGVVALWLGECLARRRVPRVPAALLLAVVGLLVQGWWMVFNAHSTYNFETGEFVPRSSFSSALAGSVEAALSLETMLSYTGLLGVLLFCCDLSRRSIWQKRIWLTLGLTGFSIALFGIILKIGGPPVMSLVWDIERLDPANNFATFRYRANAGAYLNLVFPMIAGLTFLTFQKPERPWQKAFWFLALLTLGFGIQLNPSRASWGIALGIGLVLTAKAARFYWRERLATEQAGLATIYGVIGTALALGILAIVVLGGWETGWARIRQARIDPSSRSPTEVFWKMGSAAGAWGFGPGTFHAKFPEYQESYDFGDRKVPDYWVNGNWEFAHQDYLQTLIEWGYVGAFAWAVLVVGGVGRGLFLLARSRRHLSSRWLLSCGLLGLLGVLAHSFVDFPLQVASLELFVCVLLGFCWSSSSPDAEAHHQADQSSPG